MARPQEYDREEVLLTALDLFWRQGYKTTSLSQLLESTNLSRSSFYAVFNDKHDLFLQCFEHYSQRLETLLSVVRECDEPAVAIYHYFSLLFNETYPEHAGDGCFIVNSLVEFGDKDHEFYQHAMAQKDRIYEAFKQCFNQAIEHKKINTAFSADELTHFFTTLAVGIQVKRRTGISNERIKTLLNTFIDFIHATPIDAVARPVNTVPLTHDDNKTDAKL